jgi:methylenetetrahydrofolate dehydrogenase (NADP+)/methenyltetrahydrofolate cyclohydrolase
MLILDGKAVAAAHRANLQEKAAGLTKTLGRAPGLAVVLVGDDPASQVYVRNKIKECGTVGIQSFPHYLPATTTEAELLATIDKLNRDAMVDGILVQLPLPKHLNADKILEVLDPMKDPDALTSKNVGLFFTGKNIVSPCTPKGVISILRHFKVPLAGRSAVVVGRSHIVGRPMAEFLLQNDCTVEICHSRTKGLGEHLKRAEVVVVAAGKPEFLRAQDFRSGAVVVDVGIHRVAKPDGSQRLCGDVNATGMDHVAAALSPVPGGVGPMTIISLMENTLALAEHHR